MKGLKPGEHKDMKMPFGKHKGELICDLPDDYIFWLKDQNWVHTSYPDLLKQLDIENKFRNTYKK